MKVLIAPDAFKGSLTAAQAARAIAAGLKRGYPGAGLETRQLPLADGGEGTAEVLVGALGGSLLEVEAHDPLGRPIRAVLGWHKARRLAVVEAAQAAGLTRLTPDERDPLRVSSYGVGELVRAALDLGAREIWLGLGGTATVDGGLGLAQALGVRGLDAEGRELGRGGAALTRLDRLDLAKLDPRLAQTRVTALCDVDNPLCGPDGASVYMPQKGASPEEVALLDRGLARLAEVIERDMNVQVASLAGAGAAGGLGAGAAAFLDARLVSGVEFILKEVDFSEHLRWADLVISGEGRVDAQTAYGKVIAGIAPQVHRSGKPLIAVCGARSNDRELEPLHRLGLTAVFSVAPGPASEAEALRQAGVWLESLCRQLGALLALI